METKKREDLLEYFKTATLNDSLTYDSSGCCVCAHLAHFLGGNKFAKEGRIALERELHLSRTTLDLAMMICGAPKQWSTYSRWFVPPHEVFKQLFAIDDFDFFIRESSFRGDFRRKIYDYKTWDDTELSAMDFSQSLLWDIALKGASIFHSTFRNCRLDQCDLDDSEIIEVNFDCSYISETTFYGSKWDEVSLTMTQLHNIDVSKSDIRKSDFSKTFQYESVFSDSKLSNSKFDFSHLKSVRFANSTLSKVSFYDSDLFNVSFYNAYLEDVSFRDARLRAVDFSKVRFKNVSFEGCILEGVDLPDDMDRVLLANTLLVKDVRFV